MSNITYLEHHGILGQKWGIRRYQNKDGTLTQEGIKRYLTNKRFRKKIDKENNDAKREVSKTLFNDDGSLSEIGIKMYLSNKAFKRAVDKQRQKEEVFRKVNTGEKIGTLTDSEITALATRLTNEVKIKENLDKLIRKVPPSMSEKVKKYLGDTAIKFGSKLLNDVTETAVNKSVKKIVNELFTEKPNSNQSNNQNANRR